MKFNFAKLENVEGLADVIIKTWKDTYLEIIEEKFLEEDKNEKMNNLTDRIKNSKAKILICTIENKIVGYADYSIYSDEDIKIPELSEINAIYILKGYQRQGIGKRFIEIIVDDLIKDKYKALAIWGLKDNPCTDFYKKIGGEALYSRNFEIGNQTLLEIGYLYTDLYKLKNDLMKINLR